MILKKGLVRDLALARAKELDPKNAGVWFAEGALNLRNDRPAAAEKLLQQGLRLDPKNPGAYFDLGNAQIKQGNLGAALKSFEKASGLRQNFWEAVNNQGIVLFEEGRRDAAIARRGRTATRRARLVVRVRDRGPLVAR